MFYKTNFTTPEEGLRLISQAVQNIDLPRYLYAIRDSELSPVEIDHLGDYIAENKQKLKTEYNYLYERAPIFNKEYTTEWNNFFDTSFALLKNIKNGLRVSNKIFQSFAPSTHPTRRDYNFWGVPIPNIYTVSTLSSYAYEPEIFDIDTFPSSVAGLFKEMKDFFKLMQDSIKICLKTITDERIIRNSNPLVRKLYNKYYLKVKNEVNNLVKTIVNTSNLEKLTEDIYASYLMHGGDLERFIPVAFHRFPPRKVTNFMARLDIEKARAAEITDEERAIFGLDVNVIQRIRYTIDNFDRIIPNDYNNKKLPCRLEVMLMLWCNVDKNNWKRFHEYFNRRYKENGGNFDVLKYSGFITGKNKFDITLHNSEYEAFEKSVQNLPLQQSIQSKKVVSL